MPGAGAGSAAAGGAGAGAAAGMSSPCSSTTAPPFIPSHDLSLFEIIGHFIWPIAVWILILVLLSAVRRMMGTVEKRHYHSRMMPEDWPPYIKDSIAMLILLFGVVPFMIFFVSIIFGAILRPLEDWTFETAFEYCLSNVAGLSSPLTKVVPTTRLGDFVDICISIWAMLICSSFMGVAGNMGILQRVINHMPGSFVCFMFYIFFLIPVFLVIMACVLGFGVAAAEGWSLLDGFLFMAGSLCGLANPLTSVTPASPHGLFLEILGSVSEVALGGAIVGIVGAHPVCDKFVAYLEGEGTLLKNLQTAQRKASRIACFLGDEHSTAESARTVAAEVKHAIAELPSGIVDLATKDLSADDAMEVSTEVLVAGAEPLPDMLAELEIIKALRAELEQARSSLAAAQNRVAQAESRASLAEQKLEDERQPVKNGFTPVVVEEPPRRGGGAFCCSV